MYFLYSKLFFVLKLFLFFFFFFSLTFFLTLQIHAHRFGRRALLTASLKELEPEIICIPLSLQLNKWKENGLDEHAKKTWPNKTVDDLIQMKEEYKKNINSTGEVPTLVVNDDTIITEADVISEYLDDAFPNQGLSLLSNYDPISKSRVRHYLKILGGDTGVSAMYRVLMNQDPLKDNDCRDKLYKGLSDFVRLADDTGPYFLGKHLSLADVLLIPMYDQFRFLLPYYRGIDFIPENETWTNRIQTWANAIENIDAFKEKRWDKDSYITMYKAYAGERGVSKIE